MNYLYEKIKEERTVLLGIVILFLVNVVLFWLKQGSLVVDTGREFYIPYQMLKGQVLYKDIFNIYGPLSYQINTFAYMLLGQKITSLLIFGIINSFIILSSIYFISRELLSKTFSALITLVIMYSTIFAPDLFNANIPYSYAVVYALSSFLLSVLFLIKQIKAPRSLFLYLACFFAGVSITVKYEYILYPLILAYTLIYICKLDWKTLLKCLGMFLIVPIISYVILFLQGLTVGNLYNSFLIVKKMSSCYTLKYFYSHYVGFYFNFKSFAYYLEKFGFLFLLFSLLYNAVLFESRIKNIVIKYLFKVTYLSIGFVSLVLINVNSFGLFAVFSALLLIILFKRVYVDKALFIIVLSAFSGSLKTFFGINMSLYGIFTIPLVLVSLLSLIIVAIVENSEDQFFKNTFKKSLIIILIGFIGIFALKDYIQLRKKTEFVITPRGDISSYSSAVKTTQELVNYVAQNTSKKDKIIILPETPFVNFLMDRDSDNYYNSLIPLYFEVFGEQNIIKHFKNTKPEFIVLTNRDTEDYGFKYICVDYAHNFCKFVANDYYLVKTIDNNYRMLVYKRKDLK